MQQVKNLRPSSFTIADLDDELASMAMIRALGPEYKNFVDSLILLPQLDRKTLLEAFSNHDTTNSQHFKLSTHSASIAAPLHDPKSNTCTFCGSTGHIMRECRKFTAASTRAKSERGKGNKGKKPAQQQQQANQADNTLDSTTVESAGNASLFSDSTSSSINSVTDWNTDTGATAHMTPHRHFFATYMPFRVPIRLADKSIIYSAGVGSVQFKPVIDGKEGRIVEFERVLHVPKLGCNLLAVFYLTRTKRFRVAIEDDHVHFMRDGSVLFTAHVDHNHVGRLLGQTVTFAQSAAAVSTCTLDLALWHRRFAHRNLEDVRKAINQSLVNGAHLRSTAQPDPICEPCIAGHQHRPNVPKTATRTTNICDLIHSDLHGPLPIQSREGYRYWVTFIDDMSRFMAVVPLRNKFEVFNAFKRFQAYAETQTGRKIKGFRNDKGGEYISNAFKLHLEQCGIVVQHTIRNC